MTAHPQPTTNPTACPQVQRRLWSEWHKLETAREGTMRNRGFKCAAGDSGLVAAAWLWFDVYMAGQLDNSVTRQL